jgi:hypothetical protein
MRLSASSTCRMYASAWARATRVAPAATRRGPAQFAHSTAERPCSRTVAPAHLILHQTCRVGQGTICYSSILAAVRVLCASRCAGVSHRPQHEPGHVRVSVPLGPCGDRGPRRRQIDNQTLEAPRGSPRSSTARARTPSSGEDAKGERRCIPSRRRGGYRDGCLVD